MLFVSKLKIKKKADFERMRIVMFIEMQPKDDEPACIHAVSPPPRNPFCQRLCPDAFACIHGVTIINHTYIIILQHSYRVIIIYIV